MARDGRAVGEPEIVDVALVSSVPGLDAVGDHLAERGDAFGLGVGAGAALHVLQDVLGVGHDVGGEELGGLGRVHKLRVVRQREHLAVERDGLLADALRVADVAHDDLLEGQGRWVLLELRLELPGPGDDGAANGVLHRLHVGIDRVDGDSAHGSPRAKLKVVDVRAERRGCPVRRESFNSASGAEDLSVREASSETSEGRQLERCSRNSKVRPNRGASKSDELGKTR